MLRLSSRAVPLHRARLSAQLRGGAHAEEAEDVSAMLRDCQRADCEQTADFLAAVTLDDEGGDVDLPGGERAPAGLKSRSGVDAVSIIAAAAAESCAALVKPCLRKMFSRCLRKVK